MMAKPAAGAPNRDRESPTSLIAGIVGLGGFVIAIVAGLAAQADPVNVLWRATTAMIFCYLVGLGVGLMASAAVREHVGTYTAGRPIPMNPPPPPDSLRTFAEV